MSTAPAEICPGLDALAPEYEILGELGRGGMAVVYLARERQLERDVAIKLIRARWIDDTAMLARFAREARLVACLEHPNIVRLYSVRHLPGAALALVMQYVPGVTLKEEVLRTGPLSPARAERVLREIAAALTCAHDRGIVHRDVKPDNIFIDERDGTALLADFGVARPLSADAQLTLGGMAMGTPAYMAPEQIDGSGFDARSDLYSLGLLGWEMLTGETPWEGESFYSVLHKQKTAELPSLRKLRADAPARLRTAIEVAIRKRPDERWSGVAAFLECLDGRAEPGWRAWVRDAADRLVSLAAAPRAADAEPPAAAAEPTPPEALATVAYPRPDRRTTDAPPTPSNGASPPAPPPAWRNPDGAEPQGRAAETRAPAPAPRNPAPAHPRGSSAPPPVLAVEGEDGARARLGRTRDAAAQQLPPLEGWRAWVRLPTLLQRVYAGERIALWLRGAPRVALVPAADLELLRAEEGRLAAERLRLQEWHELRAMLDRRTVADAGEQRHPRWRLYPRGPADYETLLAVPDLDASLAALLMGTYGSLDVLLGDVPAGVERRTGGRVSAARAGALLEQLRNEESEARNEDREVRELRPTEQAEN